jgi:endonuclease/exonuclease/phosphatase family metal-dependent hydrolase
VRYGLLVMLGLLGCVSTQRQQAVNGDLRLDVMSFNIRYGTAEDGENHWTRRRELVIGIFRDFPADFVGVQESLPFQTDELLAALPQFRVLVGRTRESVDTPIFYRHDRWRLEDGDTFWLSDTPDRPGSISWGNALPRIVTWGRWTERSTGRGVYVFNTHLDHRSQPSRECSAGFLVERIAARRFPNEPVILLGDFNAAEDNAAIQRLREAGLIDTFRTVHPRARHTGTFGGWRGDTDGPRIDYIFATADASIIQAAILREHTGGRYPSDHYPVTARLRLGAADE